MDQRLFDLIKIWTSADEMPRNFSALPIKEKGIKKKCGKEGTD